MNPWLVWPGGLGLPRVPGPHGPGLPRVLGPAPGFARSATWPLPGHAMAMPWPGPGQARPGNIFLELKVNYFLIIDIFIDSYDEFLQIRADNPDV